MSYFAELLNYTLDPDVVAKFQQACGLKVVTESEYLENSCSERVTVSEDVTHQCSNGHVLNDYSNGKATPVSNGEIHNSYYQCTKSVQLDSEHLQNMANTETEVTRLKHRNGFVQHENGSVITSPLDVRDSLPAKVKAARKACIIRTGTIPYRVENNFLYYVFSFGAGLGNGIFYILFYSFSYWNIDAVITRKICLLWAICMYFGQATKDILRVPRPKSPPVVRLETRYELEYGMPSTHAICGTAIPFSLLIFTVERYQEYPLVLGVVVACTWCLLVCLSRIYLGMHNILDVLVGVVFAVVMMFLIMPYLDVMDRFLLTNPMAPFFILSAPVIITFVYPKLDTWSTARGDTTGIVSICAGCYFGSWLNYAQGFMSPSDILPPYPLTYLQVEVIVYSFIRLVVGLVQSVAGLYFLKFVTYAALCYIFKLDSKDPKTKQKLIVELPYKYITNFVVSFNTVYTTPLTFCLLGIQRLSYYSEI
ncbi:sphingosine-1-phosphate phosphatase 2-like [Gigantopelta aegis]|uniref:sphingosine-1-phosphate phosphatase 2-like n=1 Tax=Gigantopelta aegis TaxID=1735272 RepID=UPI001B88DA5A|nr:sphingosine-1-phosphate phosphatase 2-like [Gigantopelta aegis]